MSQIINRKGLLFLLAIFLLTIVVVSISPLIEWFTYRTSIRQWKSAVLSHEVPTNAQFEELWDLTAFIDCKTCPVSTESNVYLSGSLKNNSPEFLISLNLLTGQVEWQQRLQNQQTLEELDSKYIYISEGATQKIAGPTQLWGAAQIIAYDLEFNEVWMQRFAGSVGVTINGIIEDTLVVDAGPGFYRVDTRTGKKIDGPRQQVLLSDRGKIQYLLAYEGRTVLYGVDTETEKAIWDHDLFSSSPQFLFEDELILIGNAVGGELGGVTVLDGKTGKVLWKHRRVISNVASSNEIVYFMQLEEGIWGQDLILDAQLLAVDIRTGETLGSLQFEPSGIQSGSGHYEYLVSASNDIVLVYLGDGRQLIALRFLPDE